MSHLNPAGDIRQAVLNGDRTAAEELARQSLQAGLPPLEIMNHYIGGIQEVGRLWEAGDYFLPELAAGAGAVAAALQVLQPELAKGARADGRRTAVIGTVQGDIHDIGKNLVGAMLLARGFTVVDLGTDVSPEAFATAVTERQAGLVCLSALLTTTMTGQQAVLRELADRGLRERLVVLVGGAPVTPAWAAGIGADGTAADAVAAAELAIRLIEEQP